MASVNTQAEPVITCGDLRAYLARHALTPREIAEVLGVTRQAVSAALRAELTGRPISQTLLCRIWDAANTILQRRELAHAQ